MHSSDIVQETKTDSQPSLQLKERYDGRDKVTGNARYAADFQVPGTVSAFMVLSTIPRGTIRSIDRAAAERAYGVLAVLTPFNAPRLPVASPQPPSRRAVSILQDRAVHYNGQPIAVVVAASLNQAPGSTKG